MKPSYSLKCRVEVDRLLRAGGSLTSYRANPKIGVGPREGSWAWRLEREIEKRFNVNHAVVVNSGTAALHCGLDAIGVRGMEVITSPISFSATVASIVLAGGIPVFSDVDPRSFSITPATIRKVITGRTKAIVPANLFKASLDTEGIAALGYRVLTDSCQSVGCRDKRGVYTVGAYSFGSIKQIPAGEGGAIATNDYRIAYHSRLLMNHAECFNASFAGYNYRMSEVTACIAYHGLLKLKDNTPFKVPYLVKKRGPNDKPYIEVPLHQMPAFRKYARGPLPVAESLCKDRLCVR